MQRAVRSERGSHLIVSLLQHAVFEAQKAAEQHAQMAGPAEGAGSALSSLISPVFSMQGVRQASRKCWSSEAPYNFSGIGRTPQQSCLTPVIPTWNVCQITL